MVGDQEIVQMLAAVHDVKPDLSGANIDVEEAVALVVKCDVNVV